MCFVCSRSATFKLITFGAHREGVFLIIAPSTRQTNRSTPVKRYQQAIASNSEVPLSTLRDELAHNNQNPLDLQDTTLYSELPPARSTIIDLIDPSAFTSSDIPSSLSELILPLNTLDALPPAGQQPRSLPSQIQPSLTLQTQRPTMSYMPNFGERAAPIFNQAKPRELPRFFKALERLFARVGVTNDKDMKDDALQYVDFEVEQIWKTFPEYADPLKSYAAFKAAVMAHYPDATGDYVYSLSELEAHIAKHKGDGIVTTDDLQEFHLKFLAITTWLIEQDQMGEFEQRRDYIRAFVQPLSGGIKNRLCMKFLDQHPNKPHKIQDVYEAARYVLLGEGTLPRSAYVPVPAPIIAARTVPVVPIDSSSATVIKAETFASVMSDFTKTIAEALQQNSRPRITGSAPSTQRNTDCNFCGGQHFIRECKVVDEYVLAGKCRRNFEGKVVLSTGAFVPREIPGTLLCERVDEWHHRNPNQLSVASLVHTISTEHIRANTQGTTPPAFQLSTADRISTLEAELFNLRAKRQEFVPLVRTRAQKARELPLATIEEVPDEEAPVAAEKEVPRVIITPPPIPVVAREPAVAIVAQPVIEPEHPFRNARDAAYTPPVARNIGATIKTPAAKVVAPAYKTLPPVHEASIALDVYKRAMDTPVTITQRELLSISPEVRAQFRDSTTTRRVPTATAAQGTLQIVTLEDEIPDDAAHTFMFRRVDDRTPPQGATVVPDTFEAYYSSLEPGDMPISGHLTVAKESTAIRSIYALVDSSQKKECTVDPGCQIIAMSENTCHSLGLAYDPMIRLNMESANGTFDWSMGLARNVPFTIGSVTLYLQVHVIRSPSYEILLGRPFDVLTESIIRNYSNEDQTITITDPNSRKQCTIPTFARGSHNISAHSHPDF